MSGITTDKDWRTNGLDDENIKYITEDGPSDRDDVRDNVKQSKLSCYLNLAAAYTNVSDAALHTFLLQAKSLIIL